MNNTSQTNWARVDALMDEHIDTSDIAPLTDDFFRMATIKLPCERETVAVDVDSETLSWYVAQGENAKERMTAALRIYAKAHQ